MFTAIAAAISLPVIGATWAGLGRAVTPGLIASASMAAAVFGLDSMLPVMAAQSRLCILVPFGALIYVGLLASFARPLVADVVALLLRRPRQAIAA
jgi:hypothetical protein